MEKVVNTFCNCSKTQTLDSEYRLDPATGLWTLIVEGRDARPSNTERNDVESALYESEKRRDPCCPFCLGNESLTPETVAKAALKLSASKKNERDVDDFEIVSPTSDGEFDKSDWFVRVFENKYPFFRMNAAGEDVPTFKTVEKELTSGESKSTALFNSISGRGRHEVIVDSRRHVRSWSEFSELETKLTFRVFRSRLRALRDSGCFAYSFVFKNVGSGAGASQRHSHCQLTGNIELPPDVGREIERLIQYERARKARGENASFWDALLDAELQAQARVVAVTERFVVYCPYASRFPVQTEICPRFDGSFEDYDEVALDELALLVRKTIAALENAKRRHYSDDPKPLDYNVVMKNVPSLLTSGLCEGVGLARPRWLILPSLVKKAGYEIGCGVDINPISPETAARLLRETF
ncbi:MAG: hypothetical protein J6X44_12825 [Thermoguttaceae bacterium]|nr:hypothetical protein [Thermoguttaceae bacterium]